MGRPARRIIQIDDRLLMARMRSATKGGVTMLNWKIGEYEFALWEENALYVQHRTSWSAVYVGRIHDGRFEASPAFREKDVEYIKLFVEHPLESAAAAAKTADVPRCACCNRRLGTKDVSRGIGMKCWEKWQWDRKLPRKLGASVSSKGSSKISSKRILRTGARTAARTNARGTKRAKR